MVPVSSRTPFESKTNDAGMIEWGRENASVEDFSCGIADFAKPLQEGEIVITLTDDCASLLGPAQGTCGIRYAANLVPDAEPKQNSSSHQSA